MPYSRLMSLTITETLETPSSPSILQHLAARQYAGGVLPCDDSRRCTTLRRQQAMYYPATTAGDAPRCNAMHFCASFALLRHGVRIFLATYTISNILYLLLFTNYDTLRKKLTRRTREGEG